MRYFTRGGHRVVAVLAGAALVAASVISVAAPAGADPAPMIFGSLTYADPGGGGPPDWTWINGLSPEEAVHVDVDFDGGGVVDRSTDGTANTFGSFAYDIGTSGFLVPGSRITATGSGWEKQLELVEVRVEYTNVDSDVVAGIAPPGSTVQVSISPPGSGPVITVPAAADAVTGWWSHDFSLDVFDLVDGQFVSASVDDGDGDLTSHGTEVRRPVVHATMGAGPAGYLLLNGWADGTPVTVTVDYGPDGLVDDTFPVIGRMFGPGIVIPDGHGPLQAGSVVTATADNGVAPDRWQKVLAVEPVTVDSLDVGTDVATGHSPRGPVSVEIVVNAPGPPPATLTGLPIDGAGVWTADFSGTHDILPGEGVVVRLPDADGDTSGMLHMAPGIPVTLDAWPTAGLWDGAPVFVNVGGMPAGTMAFLTINVASDPVNRFQWLPGVQTDQYGNGQASVSLPRFVDGFDCATAPGACILVTADPTDPFGRNAWVPLSFGRLDLFRFTPDEGGTGTIGDPITGSDQVSHDEWVWVAGTGFQPDSQYQLNQCKDLGVQVCRNTWNAMPWAYTDADGSFGTPLQVGRNVFGYWGTQPELSVSPTWDVRDGQTLAVTASGLPPDAWISDCGPGECWIGARQPWMDDQANIRSEPLTFAGDPMPVSVHLAQALVQQMEAIVHVVPALNTEREVYWNHDTGTLAYGYTAAQRWLEPDEVYGSYSPPPVEAGRYDCADTLPYDPSTGAQEPVHCALSLEVLEHSSGGNTQPFFTWQSLQFARFDLTAQVTSATLGSRPTGVTLKGEVTCTGFSPEQYLVNVEGSLSQTTGGRRPVTVTASFATTTSCSGTMANPGKAFWSVFVPGPFKAGGATATLDVSSAAFTRVDDPLHVVSSITITAPPKGKGR